ncbi:LOW QUALITY PROTEIN: hypothetical protein Cgig2_010115 [Carnegiea gigantea]|uniref:Uncharacterized protein n=1 Tax=Carnegiea gigantea TaxID=171969 RepID=A0A9Q1GVG2_9CARY|nr:LOW QUALITY PROTEIN: hypothetical protein Cgig2_010115 [Carnegiea gigantea]
MEQDASTKRAISSQEKGLLNRSNKKIERTVNEISLIMMRKGLSTKAGTSIVEANGGEADSTQQQQNVESSTRPETFSPNHGNSKNNRIISPRISPIAGASGSRFDLLRDEMEEDNIDEDPIITGGNKEGDVSMTSSILVNQEDLRPQNVKGNIDISLARDNAFNALNQNTSLEGVTSTPRKVVDNPSRRTPLTHRNARDFPHERVHSTNSSRLNSRHAETHMALKENLDSMLQAIRTFSITPPYPTSHTDGLLVAASPLHSGDPPTNNDTIHRLTQREIAPTPGGPNRFPP